MRRESPKRTKRARRGMTSVRAAVRNEPHDSEQDTAQQAEQEPPPHEPGQPPSAELRDAIYAHLRAGASWSVAAYAVSVDPEEFDRWLELGVLPNAKEPYATFARTVYRLSGELLSAAQAALFRLGKKDPRALAVLFEMRSNAVDIRGDGREDPVRSSRIKKRALREALANPNLELKAVMDEAGVLALTEQQRETLEEAGLLVPRIRALALPPASPWPADTSEEPQ